MTDKCPKCGAAFVNTSEYQRELEQQLADRDKRLAEVARLLPDASIFPGSTVFNPKQIEAAWKIAAGKE